MRDYQTKQNIGGTPDSITDTKFGAGEFNSIAVELEGAVTTSGQTLAPADGTGEDTAQLSKALSVYGSGGDFYVDTGAADAYVLDRAGSLAEVEDYFDGMRCVFVADNANTGASTVNVASLGIKSITRIGGTALSAGDISAGEHVVLRYDLANDRFEIEIYSGVKALEIGDGITVGGSASGDIPTLSSSGTFSGKDFEQSGKMEIRDTRSVATVEPVQFYAPNTTDTTQLVVGKVGTSGNYSIFGHSYTSDDSPSNYSFLGVGAGDGVFRVYNDGHAALTAGNMIITDGRNANGMHPLIVGCPNLSAVQYASMTFGVDYTTNYNAMEIVFDYDGGSGSQNNAARMRVIGTTYGVSVNGYGNVGIGTAPAGSGGAALTVNGDIVADNLPALTTLTSENAGTVTANPFAQVTTVDCGTVDAGDIFIAHCQVSNALKATADGFVRMNIEKDSGTAVIETGHDQVSAGHSGYWQGGAAHSLSYCAIFEVTTGGTLVMELTCQDGAPTSSVSFDAGEGQLRIQFIKGG